MKHKVIALTNHIDHAKILDEVSDPLATLNSHYQFTYANKALAKALGKTLEVIIGNDLWEIYSKDGADMRRDAIKKVFETGQTKVIETIVPKPSGNLYFITTVKPIFNEQNIVISVVAIAKDVTDRKQAEEALKVSELEYRNQANFLNTVTENGPFAMWVSDAEGTMIRANQSLRNILNLTNDMLIGKYNVLHDENLDAQGFMPVVEAVFNDLKSTRFAMYWTGTKAGDVDLSIANELWIDVSMFPITDEVGKLVNVVCQYVDITERKLAEEEIKNHREHLALINQILRHDLTNDLVVIQSALNLYNDSPEEELLGEISSHAGKSLELIGKMRGLESFLSNHRKLKVCDMLEIIDEVIRNYTFIDFKIKGKAQVMADDSLSSVIDNIIRNAVNHGKADRITITTGKERDMCEVRIADNGTGIPDEIKGKVFEEGFVYGDTGHTGLGLHIVEKAMENYGGYAYVEDNEPKGAVFALRFKMVK